MSSRRRHRGNRDDPDPNRCIGVFGLSLSTRERDLEVRRNPSPPPPVL